MATTIDKIRTFKHRKGQGQRAKGSQGKTCSKCGMSHPPRECPVWGKKCHKCGNKNHFSTYCRSKQSGARNRKSHSTSRGCKGKGKPHHSRSRSKAVTKSAHSIESASFQDHSDDLHGENADLHGDQQGNLHGMNSFQDHQESTDFVKKSFSTISRSKSVASISNNTDPEGKTKILTVLQIKLPHCNSIDDITVKVDDGAGVTFFLWTLSGPCFLMHWTWMVTQNQDSYRGSKTFLECYDNGKLINHGSIKLRLQHYLEKSFQDHSFYVVETKTLKPIIIGHPVSIRLGLIWVLCKNISKSVLAIEKTEKQLQELLSRPSTEYWWQNSMEMAEEQIWVISRP